MLKAAAVVVAFNPDDAFAQRCARCATAFELVVVVDNGSDAAVVDRFPELKAATYIVERIEKNVGLGAALNAGIRIAQSYDQDWVCLFDQDSTMDSDFVKNFELSLGNKVVRQQQIGFLSPLYVDEKSGETTSYARDADLAQSVAEVDLTITSGNFVPVTTFRAVGMFDEGFFIDYLDYDFCFRCKKANLKIFEVRRSRLFHNLGNSELKSLIGKKFFVTHHSAVRRYYMARNRIIVFKRFFLRFPIATSREIGRLPLDLAKIIFFEKEKTKKISFTFRGILDGLMGRSGKIEV